MIIRFNIPNGRMEINLETFFQEARRPGGQKATDT
jgi:hypothetical protein